MAADDPLHLPSRTLLCSPITRHILYAAHRDDEGGERSRDEDGMEEAEETSGAEVEDGEE